MTTRKDGAKTNISRKWKCQRRRGKRREKSVRSKSENAKKRIIDDLIITTQRRRDHQFNAVGDDNLFLDWKSPARGSGATVRTYVIERREQPAGNCEFGSWAKIGIALETETTLSGQQLEYRIKAVNAGGESIPSNTTAVLL